ncbi:MAG: NOG1 family protein [Methanobacteriota archaeon]
MDFTKIPTVLSADEIIDKAFRRAGKIKPQMGDEGRLEVRRAELSKIRTAQNTANAVLERVQTSFPSFDQLHPFFHELCALQFDVRRAQKALAAVAWAQGQIKRIGDREAARIKRTEVPSSMRTIRTSAYGRMASVVKQVGKDLDFLAAARAHLKALPSIELAVPTLVIAGYPNVGKSSLVRAISTGTPEVAPYPFTTKGIIVGHFVHRRVKYQAIDTPGLLDRPLADRNKIELHAILALQHLGDAIVYLIDPAEHCGYSLEAQEKLLSEIKKEFTGIPILEVETKGDLPVPGSRKEVAGSRRLTVSSMTKKGLSELVDAAVALVPEEEKGGVASRRRA